jgi:peptidoglycan/LPS O-acetylase OafA/YrhL
MPSASSSRSARFDLLDAIRGIAAIAVMMFHYTSHNGLDWIPGAWVAVDLFFVLSGFVIAHSYARPLLDGMRLREFLVIRVIRLGPLYLFGLLLGAIAMLSTTSHRGPEILRVAALGAIGFPYFNHIDWPFGGMMLTGALYPLNDPAWSLCFEFIVNVAFVGFVQRFRAASAWWFTAGAYALFVGVTSVTFQTNPGWSGEYFYAGIPRVFAAFFAGALFYGFARREYRALTFACCGIAFGLFFSANPKLQLLNSVTFVPAAVYLASSVRVTGMLQRACRAMGDLSYPLYIVHFPMYRLLWHPVQALRGSTGLHIVLIAALTAAVAAMLIPIDAAARRWVRTAIRRPRSPVPAV